MSKQLTIGNKTFLYPTPGTLPEESWGNEATDWAVEVSDVLSNIQAPNDITLTTVSLADNQVTPANIVGLKFSTVAVLSIKVEYIIKRIVGVTTLTETGVILGSFDGTNFSISQTAEGDAGISIDVTNLGQFQYTSTNLSHTTCIIKFRASTIAN